MATHLLLEQVTDVQLARFAELIYDTAGIKISPQKKTMLSNRIRRRLKANNLTDYDVYYNFLKSLSQDDPEWDAFLQEVSTHETYLFRDEAQWEWVQREFLPEVVADARSGRRSKSLRVWSAACSTGDEAYTMAVCIAATINDPVQWDVKILGTDIGIGAIRTAENAEFDSRAMKLVPDSIRRRFFDASAGNEKWTPKSTLTGWTAFRQHNLLNPLREKPFDLVILKNVLIYFDMASKQRALSHVLPLIRPSGAFITAAAEGVSGLVTDLEKVKPWLYRKHAPSAPRQK